MLIKPFRLLHMVNLFINKKLRDVPSPVLLSKPDNFPQFLVLVAFLKFTLIILIYKNY